MKSLSTNNWRTAQLGTILFILSFLLALSLFKNISYPLFWADESMTAMGGVRVLEYGYPKVHDGKNVLYDLQHPDTSLGVDKKTDAYIGGANWLGYYVAAVGIKLADLTDDIYTKTAIIRSLFALFGSAGLMIFALLTVQFFHTKSSKMSFLVLFVFLELLSVPLVLHLREARYYPLTVFFVAATVFIYAKYRILNKLNYKTYIMLLSVSLFFLFITFSPAYFISLATILLYESTTLAKQLFVRGVGKGQTDAKARFPRKGPFRRYMRNLFPVLISLVTVYPLIVFFDVFHIADVMAKFYAEVLHSDVLDMYINNLAFLWGYFASFDFIYLAIFLKVSLLSCFVLTLLKKNPSQFEVPKAAFSVFLTLFFLVYCLAIAKIPNPLFTRYIIPLQPVLALIMILDTAIIYNFISQWRPAAAVYCGGALLVILTGFVFFNISTNMENIEGHVYELSQPYRGPLDYVIPFIKRKYPAVENLVIATNYEETSFMYYLDARVTVGYVGNNLTKDALIVPDIIVYRKGWGNFTRLFNFYLDNYPYKRITFSVINSATNNIPELNWPAPFVHRFRTMETADDRLKLDIFLRM